MAPSTECRHRYLATACRHRRSPQPTGPRLPCGLRHLRVISQLLPSNDKMHSSSPLAGLPTPITKAQGPQSRDEATWRAAGVKFDRLRRTPRGYFSCSSPSGRVSTSLGAGRMTSTKKCQPGGAVSVTRARHLSTGFSGIGSTASFVSDLPSSPPSPTFDSGRENIRWCLIASKKPGFGETAMTACLFPTGCP